jgi:hypothetical protein
MNITENGWICRDWTEVIKEYTANWTKRWINNTYAIPFLLPTISAPTSTKIQSILRSTQLLPAKYLDKHPTRCEIAHETIIWVKYAVRTWKLIRRRAINSFLCSHFFLFTFGSVHCCLTPMLFRYAELPWSFFFTCRLYHSGDWDFADISRYGNNPCLFQALFEFYDRIQTSTKNVCLLRSHAALL